MVRFVYEPSSKIVSSPNRGAYHLWGVTFPAGVAVEADDAAMIRKCRALVELREVTEAPEQVESSAAQSAALPKVSSAPDTAAAPPTFSLETQPRKRGRPRKG